MIRDFLLNIDKHKISCFLRIALICSIFQHTHPDKPPDHLKYCTI